MFFAIEVSPRVAPRQSAIEGAEAGMRVMEKMIPGEPGCYAMVMRSQSAQQVEIGRHGWLRLEKASYYIYVGSAMGPGGLRARLRHHLRQRPEGEAAPPLHWHVDYLKERVSVLWLWYSLGREQREHQWARHFSKLKGARIPLAGFGSTDCDCAAHLIQMESDPVKGCDPPGAANRLWLVGSWTD